MATSAPSVSLHARWVAGALAGAIAWGSSACGVSDVDLDVEVALRQARDAIAGGEPDPTDTAVVGVRFADGSFCSGTLIAPNVVLTARHCVSPVLAQIDGAVDCDWTTFGPPTAPGQVSVTAGLEVTADKPPPYAASEVLVAPSSSSLFCGYDVAVVVLDGNVEPSVAQPIEPRIASPPASGETFSAVGYGAVDGEGTGAGTRRRRNGLVVDCVGEGCSPLYMRASEWQGDAGFCHGDSGGPALDAQGRVMGVGSRGYVDLACGAPIFGRVDAWAEWIQTIAIDAAAAGGYPPPAWVTTSPQPEPTPIGDRCDGNADCSSGLCTAERYCSRPCSDAEPCPRGYICSPGEPETCLRVSSYLLPPKREPLQDEGCALGRQGAGTDGAKQWLLVAALLAALLARGRIAASPPPGRCGRPRAPHTIGSGRRPRARRPPRSWRARG